MKTIALIFLFQISLLNAQQLHISNLAKENKTKTINTGMQNRLILEYQLAADSILQFRMVSSKTGFIIDTSTDSVIFVTDSYSTFAYLKDSLFYIQDTLQIAKKDICEIQTDKSQATMPGLVAGLSFSAIILAPFISYNYSGGYFNKDLYLLAAGLSTATLIISLTALLLEQKSYHFIDKSKPLKKLWKIE